MKWLKKKDAYLIQGNYNQKGKDSENTIGLNEDLRLKLLFYIDRCEIDIFSKETLKKEVQEGKIKDMDNLISKIDEIKRLYQKVIAENKPMPQPEASSDKESQDKPTYNNSTNSYN